MWYTLPKKSVGVAATQHFYGPCTAPEFYLTDSSNDEILSYSMFFLDYVTIGFLCDDVRFLPP